MRGGVGLCSSIIFSEALPDRAWLVLVAQTMTLPCEALQLHQCLEPSLNHLNFAITEYKVSVKGISMHSQPCHYSRSNQALLPQTQQAGIRQNPPRSHTPLTSMVTTVGGVLRHLLPKKSTYPNDPR